MAKLPQYHYHQILCYSFKTGEEMKGKAAHTFTADDYKNIDSVITALRELVSSLLASHISYTSKYCA